MPLSNSMITSPLKAVDFFCGAGGMSCGLRRAGLSILGGIDIDADCKKTYESNIPNAKFLQKDITVLSEKEVATFLGITADDGNLVFCGCSPCQFWSKVRTDRTKSAKTAFLLKHFERFIGYFRPGFVVVENVPGLLNRKGESILPQFLSFLTANGYSYCQGIVNAADYGVPQRRNRYLLVATRLPRKLLLPRRRKNPSLTVRRFIGQGLPPLAAGQKNKRDPLHCAMALSPVNVRRLLATPANGGDRSSWRTNPALQLPAYKGQDGIFRDVYARMYWDRPAPTITTRFNSLSNGRFGHPEQLRAISLREGALLQTFPKSFRFYGPNKASLARQIGNAVPPQLALRIGRHLNKIAICG